MKQWCLFLLLAILLVPTVTALGSTTNPTPTIRVEFSPDDAPLIFHSSELVYPSGIRQALNVSPVPGEPHKVDYIIKSYLLQGDYTIEINVSDKDQNEKFIQENFTIDGGPKKIWLATPRIDFLPEKSQDFAIYNASSFTLAFETITPAICRIKRFVPPITNLSTEFASVGTAMYFNNNPTLTALYHEIEVAPGTTFQQNKLHLATSFDYDDLSKGQYVVICQQTGIDGTTKYFERPFYIGYDTTAPSYTISFEPTVIEDPLLIATEMTIESNGDLLICDYDHTQNPSEFQKEPAGQLPTTFTDLEVLSNYSTIFKKTFTFPNIFFTSPSTEFTVQAICQNPAQLTTTNSKNYIVKPNAVITIDLEKDVFGTQNPTLQFTTNLNAICEANFQGDTTEITTSFATAHPFAPGALQAGEYDVTLRCESSVGTVTTEEFSFIIDLTPPRQPTLRTPALTCGEDIARLEILNATEKVQYNITLRQGQTVLDTQIHPFVPALSDVLHSVPLAQNLTGTLTWAVFAIDEGGLTSTTATVNTQISENDPLQCDATGPLVNVNVTVLSNGYSVLLTCNDPQSGCENQYTYEVLTDTSEECADTLAQNHPINTSLSLNTGGKFCYQVDNKAGITRSGEEILSNEFIIKLLTPEFGIANTNPFSLTLSTSRAAICAHGPATTQGLETAFTSYTPFSTQATKAHSTVIDRLDYEEFSNEETDSAPWKIICKEGTLYHEYAFTLGYDLTPPVLTVRATPNPITDPENIYTQLQVSTSDPTVCTYLNSSGVPAGFPSYDPDSATGYKTSHSVRIDYYSISQTSATQKIFCRNIAQTTAQSTYVINFALTNDLGITITSPNISNEDNFELSWQTTRESSCRYRLSPKESFQKAQTTGSLEHKQLLRGLDEGKHHAEIICELDGQKSYVATSFLIDTLNPQLEIYLQHPSCTNDDLVFVAATDSTGSKIINRYATLYGEEDVVLVNESFSTIQHRLSFTQTALELNRLEVTVVDQAGNIGSRSKPIQETTRCDVQTPTSSLETKPRYGGYGLTVTCTDANCAQSYVYSLSACLVDQTILQEYVDQPVIQKNSTNFCYWVYDTAGNLAEEKEQLVTIADQCFNGIEDPNEKGLDCGGPCLAACNTCENGIKDPFELGIDCGGTCSNACEEKPENEFIPTKPNTNTTPLGIECSIDADCAINEYCSAAGRCLARLDIQEEKGISLLGLIFIILGILLMAGGSYYIYYSQEQKKTEQQFKNTATPRTPIDEQREQELLAKKRQEQVEALRKRREEEEQARRHHVDERKEERKSLLSQFEVKKPSEPQGTETKKETTKETDKTKISTEESEDDFITLDDLHKSHAKATSSSTFSQLATLGEEKTTPHQELDTSKEVTIKQTSEKKSFSALDDLAELNQEINYLSTQQLVTLLDVQVKELPQKLQELLTSKSTDIPGITNALQELVKKGTLTKEQVPELIKGLRVR